MSSTHALVLQGVTRTFGSGSTAVTALDGLDLSLSSGSFTAVMGPSGSGKSTMLNVIAGLDSPDSGRIEITGDDVTDWPDARRTRLRRDRIGVIFQTFELVPYLTAQQNVALPARLAGRRPEGKRVLGQLAAVDLEGRADALPGELSGGQRQRVGIARALLHGPDLILADEPTGALDTESGRGVLELLRNAVDSSGATALMVTHDPAAAAYADRVVFLVDGRLVDELRPTGARVIADRLAALDPRSRAVAS